MDAALLYAHSVISGEIMANPLIERVCERFIKERTSPPRHVFWSQDGADWLVEQAKICNVKQSGQPGRVQFEPLLWQHFLLANVGGWIIKDKSRDPLQRETGTRRIRKIFLLTGKGSGKSVIIAPLIFSAMLHDSESEVYVLSPNEEASRRVWKEMRAMDAADKRLGLGLHGMFHFTGGTSLSNAARMVCTVEGYENSRFYCVGKTHLSGPIVQLAVVDEFQGMTDMKNVDELDDGTKQREEPLMLLLANAGKERQGPCWDEYVRARKMLLPGGGVDWDDSYLPLIYELPEDMIDQATERERVGRHWYYTMGAKRYWEMANPSYPTVIRDDFMVKELNKATRSDSGRAGKSEPYRMVFSIWPKHAAEGQEYIKWDDWVRTLSETNTIEEEIEHDLLKGCPLYLGLDLAETRNFTALAKVWKLDNLPDDHPHRGKLLAKLYHYTPGATLAERAKLANAQFEKWEEEGWIQTEPGNVSTYDDLSYDLAEIFREQNVQGCAFDHRYFAQFQVAMERQNISWTRGGPQDCGTRPGEIIFVDHIQTLALPKDPNRMSMPRSMEALAIRIDAKGKEPQIIVEDNHFLNWQVHHAIVIDSTHGGKKIGGTKAEVIAGKIHYDGLVALTMAVGLADWVPVDQWHDAHTDSSRISVEEWKGYFD